MVQVRPSGVGWSPLTVREREQLLLRRQRIEASTESVGVANRNFQSMSETAPSPSAVALRLRRGYAFRAEATGDASDIQGPAVEHRPPASGLVSSRGSALRFHLIAIAEAQLRLKAGKSPDNSRPIRPSRDIAGWTDLMGSWVERHTGRVHVKAQDKQVRQIRSALDALERRRLVLLPNRDRGARKHEGFLLLDEEAGRLPDESPLPYLMPSASESGVFGLPMSFMTNGWLHLLEDSEISVLLMVACGAGSIDAQAVAIPSDVRVNNYGIARDRFESHRWLSAFGLIDVAPVDRHSDGKALNYSEDGASLHRLSLRHEGFRLDALEVVLKALDNRLAT